MLHPARRARSTSTSGIRGISFVTINDTDTSDDNDDDNTDNIAGHVNGAPVQFPVAHPNPFMEAPADDSDDEGDCYTEDTHPC